MATGAPGAAATEAGARDEGARAEAQEEVVDCRAREWVGAGRLVLLIHRVQRMLEAHRVHFPPQASQWLQQDIQTLKCAAEPPAQLEILRLMAADLQGGQGLAAAPRGGGMF